MMKIGMKKQKTGEKTKSLMCSRKDNSSSSKYAELGLGLRNISDPLK